MDSENTAFQWLLSDEVLTRRGVHVHMVRRTLGANKSEVRTDLEPFFDLRTLARVAVSGHDAAVHIGNLTEVDVLDLETWSVGFQATDGSLVFDLTFSHIHTRLLTVWRLDGALDALQVYIAAVNGALYLQTGGERLLRVFEQSGSANEPPVSRIIRLFNEPILAVQSSTD